MLQSPRDSASLEHMLRDAEKWARRSADTLLKHIASGDTAYTYSGHGYIAAATHHWATVTLLHRRSLLEEADTYTHYMQPYTVEPGTTVMYTTVRSDPALRRLSDTARWTGRKPVAVTPPLPPSYREQLRNTPVIETPGTWSPEIYMELLALHTIKKQIEEAGPRNPRTQRLVQHIDEGFAATIDGLREKYMEAAPRGCDRLLVTSTKYLEPAAIYYAEKIREAGIHAYYKPASLPAVNPADYGCIAIISTGVDTGVHKRLRYTAARAGTRIIEINIDTEPLETYMYIILVTLLHASRLAGNHIL